MAQIPRSPPRAASKMRKLASSPEVHTLAHTPRHQPNREENVKRALSILGGLTVAAGMAAFAGPANASPAQSALPGLESLDESTTLAQLRRRCHRVCVKRSKWGRCRAWRTRCHR